MVYSIRIPVMPEADWTAPLPEEEPERSEHEPQDEGVGSWFIPVHLKAKKLQASAASVGTGANAVPSAASVGPSADAMLSAASVPLGVRADAMPPAAAGVRADAMPSAAPAPLGVRADTMPPAAASVPLGIRADAMPSAETMPPAAASVPLGVSADAMPSAASVPLGIRASNASCSSLCATRRPCRCHAFRSICATRRPCRYTAPSSSLCATRHPCQCNASCSLCARADATPSAASVLLGVRANAMPPAAASVPLGVSADVMPSAASVPLGVRAGALPSTASVLPAAGAEGASVSSGFDKINRLASARARVSGGGASRSAVAPAGSKGADFLDEGCCSAWAGRQCPQSQYRSSEYRPALGRASVG